MARIDRPQKFGRYELLRRIGAGGMGEVFLARLPGLGGADKLCVVKKVLPHLTDDRGFVARFVDEGRVVVHLSHGNIAQVFEMGDVDGEFFMAMEYVEGKTLAKVEDRIRERGEAMPVPLALLLALRLCDGLGYAHKKTDPTGKHLGIVHRDISPSNVMMTYEGDLKIIDFGAALSTTKEEMTAPRVVIGNLSYMAPEHARKQHTDARADIFSVGVMLWEMASWELVPSDGDPLERWRRAARPNFEKPSKYRKEVPREVDAIVMKALAADPKDRYQDAETLRDELQVVLSKLSPTTTQRALSDLMARMFEAERAAERRIIAEALGQPHVVGSPATESPTAPLAQSVARVQSELSEITDPERRANQKPSEATPTPTPPPHQPGEHTQPGAPPPRPQLGIGRAPPGMNAAGMATQPGQPPLFPDGPDELPEKSNGRGSPFLPSGLRHALDVPEDADLPTEAPVPAAVKARTSGPQAQVRPTRGIPVVSSAPAQPAGRPTERSDSTHTVTKPGEPPVPPRRPTSERLRAISDPAREAKESRGATRSAPSIAAAAAAHRKATRNYVLLGAGIGFILVVALLVFVAHH